MYIVKWDQKRKDTTGTRRPGSARDYQVQLSTVHLNSHLLIAVDMCAHKVRKELQWCLSEEKTDSDCSIPLRFDHAKV